MATAIIGGLVGGGSDAREFRVVESLASQQDKLVGRFPGIGIFGEASAGAIDGADIVVLAVKPQQMRDAAQSVAAHVADVPVVMSIAAGVRLADMSRWMNGYPRLVRAMPNTPALIREGISGAFALPDAGARGRKLAQRVLEGVGTVLWVVREELLDAVHRRVRQRTGLRVLLSRGPGTGRAGTGFHQGGGAHAGVCDICRNDQACVRLGLWSRESCARRSRPKAAPPSAPSECSKRNR